MDYVAPPGTHVGHIHLRVADLDRAIGFYRDVLGFTLNVKIGDTAAFLGAGGYHHHIGLNVWDSLGATPPPPGHTGLYHGAYVYPDRAALAHVIKRVEAAGIAFEGAADHGVSTAVYLRDPDGNGVEIYYDHPQSTWPRDANGNLTMVNKRFRIPDFVAETEAMLASGDLS